MKGALTHSVNTISVKLLKETGINEVIEFSKRLGITGELPEVLSLALGTGDVSLKEMVQAYSIFLNEGRTVEPIYLKRIEDKFGNILYEGKSVISDPVIDPQHALLMLEMMKSVIDKGTASSLRTVYGFDNEIAGKTGTTQKNTDGWFIGLYTGFNHRCMGWRRSPKSAIQIWRIWSGRCGCFTHLGQVYAKNISGSHFINIQKTSPFKFRTRCYGN